MGVTLPAVPDNPNPVAMSGGGRTSEGRWCLACEEAAVVCEMGLVEISALGGCLRHGWRRNRPGDQAAEALEPGDPLEGPRGEPDVLSEPAAQFPGAEAGLPRRKTRRSPGLCE